MRYRTIRGFGLSVILPLTFHLTAHPSLAANTTGTSKTQDSARSEKQNGNDSQEPSQEEETLSTGNLQVQVMDFTDQYLSAMGAALDEFISTEPDSAKRVAAQYWKVRYGAAAMAIASSRDPRTNLLDMVVFISAGKWAVNSYWVPRVFGTKASALSEVYEQMDERIWSSARRVLSLNQASDLRELINRWERANPRKHEVVDVRLRNLDGVSLRAFDEGSTARGILAGLRKFLGKVDTSLLYGERVMFYLQHTPHILSQQTDLTLAQIGEAFPVATVKPDTFANTIRDLPALLQQGLDKNQGSLNSLLPQIGTTLDHANTLSRSVDQTLVSVRELAQKTGDSGLLNKDPAAMVKDASQALAHLDSSISGLNRLLEKNAAGEVQTEAISRQIDARATHLMDAAFQRLLILIGIFFAGVVLVLILARWLFRFKRPAAPPKI